jgi:hypothetical protein
MTKCIIDYSNTIIYKIFCNDVNITDLYVGHTTNFIKRKYQHKILCNSSNKIKIYDIIRENGGWDNWTMIEIAKYNCKDSTEARIREQEHYDLLKPTLNTINPITNNKCSVIEIDNSIKFENNYKNNDAKNKNNNKYNCQVCEYVTNKKSSYDKHLLTTKHLLKQKATKSCPKVAPNLNACSCGSYFTSRTTLWRHKKKCFPNKEDESELTDKEIIKALLKITQNGITNNSNNNTNSNNTINNNKIFNLNFFLNETCKDAMNISDFVKSVKVELDDLENTGRRGYVQGITTIVVKNLNKIEETLRPLHCSDTKREVLYIKDNNEWTKETDDKPILTKAIKVIANENIKQITRWRDKYPDCIKADSKKNDLYLKIVSNSMNGVTKEEGDKNINKIISNVTKEVKINKY